MLDSALRSVVDPLLLTIGRRLAGWVSANHATLAGFAIGILAVPFIVFELYMLGLACITINRIIDGLDGAIAKASSNNNTGSDFGGFLDLVCDFIFYAAVTAAFGIAQPQYAPISMLLIVCYIGTGCSFMAYAAIAEKRNISQAQQQKKALHYLGGLTEGTETFAFLVFCCVFPEYFWLIGCIFATMCCVTTVARCLHAQRDFG